jgi:hypothetical protein
MNNNLESKSQVYSIGSYTLEKAGQAAPDISDDVRCLTTLHLPCDDNGYIPQEIRFLNRISIDDNRLEAMWGTLSKEKTTRYKQKMFYGRTYATAFEAGEKWAESELQKLHIMISNRAIALTNADQI